MSGPVLIHYDKCTHHGGERPADPQYLVWHTTRSDWTAKQIIDWLNSTPEKQASYHYLIDRDGTVTRMLDASLVAWACGDSNWPYPIPGDGTEDCRPNGGDSLNKQSISIAWCNKDGEALTVQQKASGLWLAKIFMTQDFIPPSCNLGHCEISPKRKPDPECAGGFSMTDWRRQVAAYVTPTP